jgi:hypothetical protein
MSKESESLAVEIVKLRRMLAFEADLPSHELGYWKIERQNDPVTIENDDPPRVTRLSQDGVGWRIGGEAQCIRCGKRYEIPLIGNFHCSFEWTQEWEDSFIARAAEWVARIAERDGPCWGDVPQPPETPTYIAVMDALEC